MKNDVHVYPVSEEHETEKRICWCIPRYSAPLGESWIDVDMYYKDRVIVIHNKKEMIN